MGKRYLKKTSVLCGSKGFTLTSILVAGSITLAGIGAFSKAISVSRSMTVRSQKEAIAQAYAAELLEAFRALPSATLNTYLQANLSTTPSAYLLCSDAGILQRPDNIIWNPDPNVVLGGTPLDQPGFPANRFYNIQVVDQTTMQFQNGYCNQTVVAANPLAANPNFRYFVTVGVSWILNNDSNKVRRLVLSTVIPN